MWTKQPGNGYLSIAPSPALNENDKAIRSNKFGWKNENVLTIFSKILTGRRPNEMFLSAFRRKIFFVEKSFSD